MNDLLQVTPADRRQWPESGHAMRLLLVDSERCSRGRLQRTLQAHGFAVASVASMREALEHAAKSYFGYAVVEMRLPDGDGLTLLRRLLQVQKGMRVVIHTDFDSFASVVLALRAGATDYLTKPVDTDALLEALHGNGDSRNIIPDMPLGVERLCWEYVHRIFEQCERNVTRTAKVLRMHRRTLQRMLGKRAPRPRAIELT
jgi:two-component system response regulator RegA